jgi:4-hydroxy-2-oxoheptanedioate aldolase
LAIDNPFRQALTEAADKALIGVWSMLNSTNVTEGLAASGFDWILIDGEHAAISLGATIDHLRAVAGAPIIPIVRLPWNDPILIKQYLDAGAATLMLPFVQSIEEATDAVNSMRYPPRGRRGLAMMHRAGKWGRIAGYPADADEGLFLITQIETAAAVTEVEAIASVDGVDAVFFGPGDLAASLGLAGQPGHPSVTEMIDQGITRARRAGGAVGVLAPNEELARHYIDGGVDFVSVANDAAILFRTADGVARDFTRYATDMAAPAAQEAS